MFPTPSEDKLRELLEIIDIDSTVIAGGVIRDIILGARGSKDIDVFVEELPSEDRLKKRGLFFVKETTKDVPDGDEYLDDNNVVRVLYYQWGDALVNLILVKGLPRHHIDTFDLSSTMCYMDPDGKIVKMWAFNDGLICKDIYLVRGTWTEKSTKRAKQTLEKFPKYFETITSDDKSFQLVRHALGVAFNKKNLMFQHIFGGIHDEIPL